MTPRWRAGLVALVLGGCLVERPPLDEGLFPCREPADCVEGFVCAEGNVLSVDFCRPAAPCAADEVPTADGACLATCAIRDDGTDTGCDEGFACVRIDAFRDVGVCFPAERCTQSTDCASEGEVCLTDRFDLNAVATGIGLQFDRLYCTAIPVAGRCPEGYLAMGGGGDASQCFAPCRVEQNDRLLCPPAQACLSEIRDGDTSFCLPGVWGSPCVDDTDCLLGRCRPIAEDGPRACTETVAGLEDLGQLDACADLAVAQGAQVGLGVRVVLRPELVGGEATCVPRYDLSSRCDGVFDCVGGAVCQPLSEGGVPICLAACATAQDCARVTGEPAAAYLCLRGSGGGPGVCFRPRPNGAACVTSVECASGRCGGGLCRACTDPMQCTTQSCIAGRCTRCPFAPCADGEACLLGQCVTGS
ncbi:MAG: hypothetical protein ACFCGT_17075 [Sandaracinaceae bacterium]